MTGSSLSRRADAGPRLRLRRSVGSEQPWADPGLRSPETREDLMPGKAKTLLIWLVVIFLIYAIVTSPDRAADVVRALWDVITGAFASFGRFFAGLAS